MMFEMLVLFPTNNPLPTESKGARSDCYCASNTMLSGRGSHFTSSSRRTISSQEAVKMISQHQMPADPKPERLDEPQVRAIQTKINNKLKPAKPVRTRTPSRAQSLAALLRSTHPAPIARR